MVSVFEHKTSERHMNENWCQLSGQNKNVPWIEEQDGRLAPAYFSQEHKYFDQHLPTVKDETIV